LTLRGGRSGNRILLVAWFSVPMQTDPEAHPAYYTTGRTACFSGQSGHSVVLTTHPILVPRLRMGWTCISFAPLCQHTYVTGWSFPLYSMDPKVRNSVECAVSDTKLKTYKQVQFNVFKLLSSDNICIIQQISHNIDVHYINVQTFMYFHSLYML